MAPQTPPALGTSRRSRDAPRSRARAGGRERAPRPPALGWSRRSRDAPRSRARAGGRERAPRPPALGWSPWSRDAPRSRARAALAAGPLLERGLVDFDSQPRTIQGENATVGVADRLSHDVAPQ